MSKKINSLILVLLLVSVIAQISLADDKVKIEPQKIILNDSTRDETIKASIPMQLSSTISKFNATIKFDEEGDIKAKSYKYCAIDDILHIYFNKQEVIKFLSDNNISGKKVTASVSGSLMDGDKKVTFSGEDEIEVVKPKEDTRYRKAKDTKEPPKKGKDN